MTQFARELKGTNHEVANVQVLSDRIRISKFRGSIFSEKLNDPYIISIYYIVYFISRT